MGNIPYRPTFLREIRNYYRNKCDLVSKKIAISDNFIQYHYVGNQDSCRCFLINDNLKDTGRKIYQETYGKKESRRVQNDNHNI